MLITISRLLVEYEDYRYRMNIEEYDREDILLNQNDIQIHPKKVLEDFDQE